MNFSELKTKVLDWTDNTKLTSVAGDLVNVAVKKIEREWNYKGMVAVSTGTLSTDNIAFPTRYKDLKSFFITSSGKQVLLVKKDWEYMNSVFSYGSTETGVPEMCASKEEESKIYVRRYPDTSYAYTLRCYVYSADMTADADTNWLLTNHWDAALYGALIECGVYIPNDPRLAVWQTKFNEVITQIRHAEIKESLTGSYQNTAGNFVV